MKKGKKPLLKMKPLLQVPKKPETTALAPVAPQAVSAEPVEIRKIQGPDGKGGFQFHMTIATGKDVREFGLQRDAEGRFRAWTNRETIGQPGESPVKAAGMFLDLFRDLMSPTLLRPKDDELLSMLIDPDED